MSGCTSRDIADWHASGLSSRAIADMAGSNPGAVKSRLHRMGLRSNICPRTVRDLVEDMKPLDAVEYLLGVIEEVSIAQKPGGHPVDAWESPPSGVVRRLAIALFDAPGLVTHGALYSAAYFDRLPGDDPPMSETIKVHLVRLRKVLPDGLSIVSVSGIGYEMRADR